MHPASQPSTPTGASDDIRTCLNRAAASRRIGSKRRAELLRYLVEQTLAGKQNELSEYAVALDVFHKPDSFDPRLDSSVRAEMHRLRQALAKYYEAEGKADPWRFDFSSRGYAPAFVPFEPAAATGDVKAELFPWRKAGLAAAALALAALGAWGVWRLAGGGLARAVIVLPFTNLTGDPGNEYLSDGLTEGLTDSLSHIASLRVVARTSAFQFKGKADDIRQIGRRVSADMVIEGSLRKTGDGVRVTVQVVRASDGYHVLSRAFDGGPRDLGRIERDMTVPVIAVLRPSLSPRPAHVPDPEAYDLFRKARALRGYVTRDVFPKYVAYLNQAIQRDPQYAEAYGALAMAYTGAALTSVMDPLDAVPSAKAAAASALQLDPGSAFALAAEGYLDGPVLGNWKQGEDELRRAARLMPQSVAIRQWYGMVLTMQGRFNEGLPELRVAEDLDPLPAAAGTGLGMGYFLARRYDDALAQWRKVAQLHPEAPQLCQWVAIALMAKGRYDEAMAELQRFPDEAMIAHLLALSGKRDEAKRRVDKLAQAGDEDPSTLAAIYGVLGDRDTAFALLDKALAKRKGWMCKVHPFFDPLRGDPRYAQVLKRAGFLP